MLGNADPAEHPLHAVLLRLLDDRRDPTPGRVEPSTVGHTRQLKPARITLEEMRLNRERAHVVEPSFYIVVQHGRFRVPAHANSARSCARARIIRVFTVPAGIPSSLPASRVVNPSNTVACTTARNSGASRSRAPPTS